MYVPFYLRLLTCSLILTIGYSQECPPEMRSKCYCMDTVYGNSNKLMYVVNCTDTAFTDVTPLQHLPVKTEVLIFTGNNISELPYNVFGTLKTFDKLKIVDMSNNQIHVIRGKSYHHVANVERLILNHNRISISEDYHHARIFSNFINLKELHLTNAFADNSDNLDRDLHDIFVSSNLTKLLKLHLEQNEVSKIKDRQVFCDLPELMDLHLGDNNLKGLEFNIECLHKLRYIDLEGNSIRNLSKKELSALDALPARNQSLRVDFTDNPFSCECGIDQLFDWLKKTKVEVKNSDKLKCHRLDGEIPPKHPEQVVCDEDIESVTLVDASNRASGLVLGFLTTIGIFVAIFLLYTNRIQIRRKLTPMVETVSRKVYYSSIGNNDDQEVEV